MTIKCSKNVGLSAGSVAVSDNGNLSKVSSALIPEYVVVKETSYPDRFTYLCYPISEEMVFLVEYESSFTPTIGMCVGPKDSKDGQLSSVIGYASNGKGIIIALHDNPNLVYVRFNR